ncbi:hypothetical protein TWF694_005125 [Orbilia ellipsospora]
MVLPYNVETASIESRFNHKYFRPHLTFLFNVPHFKAGIAEWAVITATSLGILFRARRPRTAIGILLGLEGTTPAPIDWSQYKEKLEKLVAFQKAFRCFHHKHSKKPKGSSMRAPTALTIVGCFAMLPIMKNDLFLSPEWTFLTTFIPTPINKDHFNLTKLTLSDKKPLLAIFTILKQWFADLEIHRFGVPFSVTDFQIYDLPTFADLSRRQAASDNPAQPLLSEPQQKYHSVIDSQNSDIKVGDIILSKAGDHDQISIVATSNEIMAKHYVEIVVRTESVEVPQDQLLEAEKEPAYRVLRNNYIPEYRQLHQIETNAKGEPLPPEYITFKSIMTTKCDLAHEYVDLAKKFSRKNREKGKVLEGSLRIVTGFDLIKGAEYQSNHKSGGLRKLEDLVSGYWSFPL